MARYATQVFDKEKKVAAEDIHTILEAARLSPSSIGIEAWKFLSSKVRKYAKRYSKSASSRRCGMHRILLLSLTVLMLQKILPVNDSNALQDTKPKN
ncbi:MAG: nitroreductase family protein [bacterium]